MTASPELLLSLTPATLRALLSTFAPGRHSPRATPESIVRDIFTSVAAKRLEATLSSAVARFSPRGGRTALHEAALATSDAALAETILATPCADVAALFAIEIAKTTKPGKRRALRRLFALAAHRVERDLPERPTYELVARVPSPSSSTSGLTAPAALKLLSRALGARLVDAWSATDADGTLRFALFLKQPTENRLVYDEASKRVVQRRDVPVAVDLVRISPSAELPTRVAITTAMPELLPVYAEALSLSLLPSFTLRPLADASRETLDRVARETRGVARIDVVGLRYRRPDGERVEVRAPDALAAWRAQARTGYVDRVTIRFTLDEGRTVDAYLHLPHRVEISDRAFEAPVRAALSALGVFAPGALPDDARSLAPYVHGDWRWRAVLGDAGFERLVRLGLLVRTLATHVASHEHRMHGAAYVVRDVPGENDAQYALAEDRSLGARLVGPKDRVAWRLDTSALAAAMMRDLGAHPAPAPLAIAGVLDLGLVTLASGKLRIVYAMAEPPAGWVEAVRRACGVGVTPVVLVPAGHAGEARGMQEVELRAEEQLGGTRIGRVLGRVAEALGVGDEVEAWRRSDDELVVEAATERTWLTGVQVPFKDRAYGLVHHLAGRAGVLVPTKQVGSSISSADAPDVTARKAKKEAETQAHAELARAGVDTSIVKRLIVVEGRKGYRLGVTARVV